MYVYVYMCVYRTFTIMAHHNKSPTIQQHKQEMQSMPQREATHYPSPSPIITKQA